MTKYKKHRQKSFTRRFAAVLLTAALITGQGGGIAGIPEELNAKAAYNTDLLPEPEYLYTFEPGEIAGSAVESIGSVSGTASITGTGSFETDEEGGYFNNATGKTAATIRQNYLSLPSAIGTGLYESKGISTVSMWIKAPETGTGNGKDYGLYTPLFAAKNSQDTTQFYPAFNIGLRGTQQINCNGYFDNTGKGGIGYLSDHAWHHVTAVFDGKTAAVYIDGNVYNTVTVTEPIFNGTDGTMLDSVSVGGNNIWTWNDPDAGLYFDDVAVYFSALTSGQVKQLYGNGRKTSDQDVPVEPSIKITDAELDNYYSEYNRARNSVHDPSIVTTGEGADRWYYIFGSHMGVSKSQDLQNWKVVTSEDEKSTLFGDASKNKISYNQAFLDNQLKGTQTLNGANGKTYTVDFGTFNGAAWCTAVNSNTGEPWTVKGNMWAPDVIFNKMLNKWCMYLSLNGNKFNSVIILLTSDNIEGPYVYQAPIVFSGFNAETDSQKSILSYKNTDMEQVLSMKELTELPERYRKMENDTWGTYWPHAIDPVVFYDKDGKLWMSYGSWFGGIYVLELDEDTGLRDYSVDYGSDYDQKGAGVTCDPYFGKKIAGGFSTSGEGSYIKEIGGYYYLFLSYGFYSPTGGYEMRVFRSEHPDGPYVDQNGISAIYNKAELNYGETAVTTRGMKLMGNYQWNSMKKGEVAQGHNSAFVDSDGKSYVIYHTKFDDGTDGHELRVHPLYTNENGWIIAAPYEYAGETLSSNGYLASEITGDYDVIVHRYGVDYAKLETVKPIKVTLNADGSVTGAYSGTWVQKEGTPYADITLGGVTYQGVFCKQTIDGTRTETICFTAVSGDGVTVWGSHRTGDAETVAANAKQLWLPQAAFGNLDLPGSSGDGVTYTYTSGNKDILSDNGIVTLPAADTIVPMTIRLSKGDYYYETSFDIKVFADRTETQEEKIEIASYYVNQPQDLSEGLNQSLWTVNPFHYQTTAGIDLTYGASIEFDVRSTETADVPRVLATLVSFLANKGADGRLYFTPGSYLGYNAGGKFFDANIKEYALAEDYIKDSAHVELRFTPRGFAVYVNGTKAYDQKIIGTENGKGDVTDYSAIPEWLKTKADRIYFGYGSWWSATGYDEANAEISNVICSVITEAGSLTDYSEEELCDWVDEAIREQLPVRSEKEVNLPVTGEFGTTITWTSESSLLDGSVLRVPEASEIVSLTAAIHYGTSEFKYQYKIRMKGSKEPFYSPDAAYAFQGTLEAEDSLTAAELTGSIIGAETQKTAEFATESDGRQSLRLTGEGSYGVKLPETAGEDGITLIYRVKADTTTGSTPQVFLAGELGTNQKWISIGRGWQNDGTMMIWSRDSVSDRWYDYCITPFTTGEWHTVAVALTGTKAVLYMDGVRSEGEIPDIVHEGLELYLGVNAWDTPFDGRFAELKVFNRALTDQELQYYFCDSLTLKEKEQLVQGVALDPEDSSGNTWLISKDSEILSGSDAEGFQFDLKEIFAAALPFIGSTQGVEIPLELTVDSTIVTGLSQDGVQVTFQFGQTALQKTFKLVGTNPCQELLLWEADLPETNFQKPNIKAYDSFRVTVVAVPEREDAVLTDSIVVTAGEDYEIEEEKTETDAKNRKRSTYRITPKTTTGETAVVSVQCGTITTNIPYRSTRIAPEKEISYPMDGSLESETAGAAALLPGGSGADILKPTGTTENSDFIMEGDKTAYNFLNKTSTLLSTEPLTCENGYTIAVQVKPQKKLSQEDAALIHITGGDVTDAYAANGPFELVLGSTGGLSLRFFPSAAQWNTSTEIFAVLPMDQYSDVILTVQGTILSVYVNGTCKYQKDVATIDQMSAEAFYTTGTIRAAFGSSPWCGTEVALDAVKLYDYCLDSKQINTVFAEDAVDKTGLSEAFAEAAKIKAEDYSAEDYEALQEIVKAGKLVYQTPEATQAETDAAAAAIRNQIHTMNSDYKPVGTITAEIVYGTPLSEAVIQGTINNTNSGETVTGTFYWEVPNADQIYPRRDVPANYTVTFLSENKIEIKGIPVELTVQPRTVVIKAEDVSTIFGTAVQPNEFTFEIFSGSLAAGDEKEDLGIVLSAKNLAGGNAGIYEIGLDSCSNINYQVSLKPGGVLTIQKAAAPILEEIKRYQPCMNGGAETISLTGLLAENAGTVSYAIENVEDTQGLLSAPASIENDGSLSYALKAGEKGSRIIVIVRLSSDNYEDAFVNVVLELTDKTLVTIQGVSIETKEYDGLPPVISGKPEVTTVTGGSITLDSFHYLYTSTDESGYSSTQAPIAAGSYQLVISVPEDNSEYAGSSHSIQFTIQKRKLTITAQDVVIGEGEPAPEYQYHAEGLAENESLEMVVLSCLYQPGDAAKTYPIIPSDAKISGGNQNYDILYKNGTLTVQKKYSITFQGGDAIGTAPVLGSVIAGTILKLPENTFQKDGYQFNGWMENNNSYLPGADYIMPERDVTFIASWEKSTTPEPTVSPKPTQTPEPTVSPKPTQTPEPTAEPTKAPEITVTEQEDGSTVTVSSMETKDASGNKVTEQIVVEKDADGTIISQRQEIIIENLYGKKAVITVEQPEDGEAQSANVVVEGVKSSSSYRRGEATLQVEFDQTLLQQASQLAKETAKDYITGFLIPEEKLLEQLENENVKNVTIIVETLQQAEEFVLQQLILPERAVRQAGEASKNISVVLKTAEDSILQWQFDGERLAAGQAAKDINLWVESSEKSQLPVQTVQGKTEYLEAKVIDFAHKGILPAAADVRLTAVKPDGIYQPGDKVYLYDYDLQSGKLLELPANQYEIQPDGTVQLHIAYGSSYVLLKQPVSEEKTVSLLEQITAPDTESETKLALESTMWFGLKLPATIEKVASFQEETLEKQKNEYTRPVTIRYFSSDPSVATVAQNGKIKAIKSGKTVITAVIKEQDGSERTLTQEIEIN